MNDDYDARSYGALLADDYDAIYGDVFDTVLLFVSTTYALGGHQGQIACFANAARHLAPGGRFVIEAWVPDPPRGEALGLKARRLGRGYAGLVIEDHDAARQILSTTQIVIDGTGRTRSFPLVHRYAWPSELDLMALLNGLTLEDRWADWQCRPFDARSTDHISVWRYPEESPGSSQGEHDLEDVERAPAQQRPRSFSNGWIDEGTEREVK